jgi:hypothetical protein
MTPTACAKGMRTRCVQRYSIKKLKYECSVVNHVPLQSPAKTSPFGGAHLFVTGPRILVHRSRGDDQWQWGNGSLSRAPGRGAGLGISQAWVYAPGQEKTGWLLWQEL